MSFPRRRPRLLGAIALALGLALAHGAQAGPSWLGRALNLRFGEKRASAANPARYEIDSGGGFVLDRGSRSSLLKFDDSPEIWVLTTARGPRGDLIFSNDLGQPLLRTTKFGGVTVFTRRHPEGSAAALEGPSVPIRLIRVDAGQLFQRLLVASARASHAAGRPVSFQALEADPGSSAEIADAAVAASEAVIDLAMGPGGRALLARLARVDIVQGRRVAAGFGGGILTITIVPRDGLLGRPSSAVILRALGGGYGSIVYVSRPGVR